MTKESFLRGAAILALASTISRVIGLVYMVVLPRLISDAGMGLFQLVKPIHYFAAVLAIAGLPVAIAKLIAEQAAKGSIRGVKRVFRIGNLFVFCTGSIVSLALFFGAPWFTQIFAQGLGVEKTIAILGPACFFLALSAGMRGFFHGLQEMVPTAVSQIIDQVVRVIATIFFSVKLRSGGVEQIVTGLAWGFVLGELSGWLVLMGFYLTWHQKLYEKIALQKKVLDKSLLSLRPKQTIKRLIRLSAPAVVATILWPIMQMADSLVIPGRMQVAGFSATYIRETLGHLGMALTLAQFSNIITVALATSLVPAISEAWALRKKKLVLRRAEEAMRMALLFGIPFFVFLFVLAEPLSVLLFSYQQVAPFLKVLALGTITLGLIQTGTGILQGLGLMSIPVRNLAIGVLLKFTLNYVLIPLPRFGALGAAYGSTLAWFVVALLNLTAIYFRVGKVIRWRKSVIEPALAAVVAGFSLYHLQMTLTYFLPFGLATITAMGLAFLFYFLILMIYGVITWRDFHLIPRIGPKLGQFFQEWGFLRN